MKNVKAVEVKKYAIMKEKLLLLMLRQFINNRQNPRKNNNPQIDTTEKKMFSLAEF